MPERPRLPLDYDAARACAWLEALEKAVQYLPASVKRLLWQMDCDSTACSMAAASLFFPVQTVTPDISASRGIDLYLRENTAPSAEAAFEDPEILLTRLSLLLDMQRILKTIKKIRPENYNDPEKAAELDQLAESLERIWDSSRSLQKEDASAPDGAPLEGGLCLMDLIMACENKLAERENHAALLLAERAFQRLERSELDSDPMILKKYLEGRILRLRALALWRQSQLALAENDLERAAAALNGTGLSLGLLGRVNVDLGELKKARRDFAGMCGAFRNACAHGECAPYAFHIRQGLCAEEGR